MSTKAIMSTKAMAKAVLAAVLTVATLAPALAATRHMHAPRIVHTPRTGACAQPSGRCISNCDQLNWCQMNTCVNGHSTPVLFWRCFQPSGLCLAPHC